MVNEQAFKWGSEPSSIRELFAYGQQRKAELGEDKVFDFSLGNPSIPSPACVGETIQKLGQMDPATLHAYSQSAGHEFARKAIADNLNKRFGTAYGAANLYLTCGAAASLSCCFGALCERGVSEVVAITPYFPEYRTFVQAAGATIVDVPARTDTFQIDVPAVEAALTERTQAVIINTPNNPVGVVYTEETLRELARVMEAAQERFGHDIYLISDEPYRELVYGGVQVPWVPALYANTLVCYSWSKSLSLPGDRIGYVLVPNEVNDHERVFAAVAGAGRGLGYVCAPTFFQYLISEVVDAPADVEAYAQNRAAFTAYLDELGYDYIAPDGAFYLWIKALEPDAQAFSDRAKAHELLLVASDSFGVPGWVRAGYCVSAQTIAGAKEAFAALKREYA